MVEIPPIASGKIKPQIRRVGMKGSEYSNVRARLYSRTTYLLATMLNDIYSIKSAP